MKGTINNIEAKRVVVSLAPIVRIAANMAARAVRSARARKAAQTRRINNAVREAMGSTAFGGENMRRALHLDGARQALKESREAREWGDLAAAYAADERRWIWLTEARRELHAMRWLYLDSMKRAGYAEDVARAAAPRLFADDPELDPDPGLEPEPFAPIADDTEESTSADTNARNKANEQAPVIAADDLAAMPLHALQALDKKCREQMRVFRAAPVYLPWATLAHRVRVALHARDAA